MKQGISIRYSVGKGAALIALFSVISKLLGFLRDRLLADQFGASRITDVYFASFKIPDLIFNILILGALSASFIPVYQKVLKRDPGEAESLTHSVITFFLLVVLGITALLYVFAPQLVPLTIPGFTQLDIQHTVELSRIMLLSVIFFTASNIIGAILNAHGRFWTYSVSPVLYNIGIIIGIVYFYDVFGMQGLAWGVVLGALLHLLVQLTELIRRGWRYSVSFKKTTDLLRIIQLMIPRMLGLAANQLSLIIVVIVSSLIGEGALSSYTFAFNLQSFPVGIFGVSLAVAVFPRFTSALSDNNTDEFTELFSKQLRRILYFLIPIGALLLILRAHITRVILGTGAFDWNATITTAQALGFFALSIPSQGLIPVLARSFYALEDTKTPVKIALYALVVTSLLTWFLGLRYGVVGIALSFSLGMLIQMMWLYMALHKRIGGLDDDVVFRSIMRISGATLIASAVAYLALQILAPLVDTRTLAGIFLQGAAAGLAGLASYGVVTSLLQFEEIRLVRRAFNRIFGKNDR